MNCLRTERKFVLIFRDNLKAKNEKRGKLIVKNQALCVGTMETKSSFDDWGKHTVIGLRKTLWANMHRNNHHSISKHFSNLHNISFLPILIYTLTEKKQKNKIFTIQLLIVMSCRKQKRELNHVEMTINWFSIWWKHKKNNSWIFWASDWIKFEA